jgi:hypothetical protein
VVSWALSPAIPVLLAGEVHIWFADRGDPVRLLRHLLGAYVGRRPDSIRLDRSEGRVKVPGFPIACDVAAVPGAVLMGFSGSGQIGVSVERLRADIPYPDRNLTPPALARVRAHPPQARNELAAWEWSRQEALRKLGSAGVLLGMPELPGFAPAAAVDKPRALRTFQLHRIHE